MEKQTVLELIKYYTMSKNMADVIHTKEESEERRKTTKVAVDIFGNTISALQLLLETYYDKEEAEND